MGELGSLIEGTVKLFLAVYYEDYKKDLENLKQTQAWHAKKEKLLDPDGLRLEVLIQYCEKAELFDAEELALLKQVQARA
jgi:predicted alpha-1,6-mannanase (GH76 family)